jgi:hemerythrin superfamily protein
MNIFEELRADHETQRDLVARLVETTGDSDERDKVFTELVRQLEAHAVAEERYFYVALMESDLTQEKARHSVAEHKELDDYVEALQGYDRTAPAWLETARTLEHRLTHHLDEEEHEVFQLAGKALADTQKTELAASYRTMMNEHLDA